MQWRHLRGSRLRQEAEGTGCQRRVQVERGHTSPAFVDERLGRFILVLLFEHCKLFLFLLEDLVCLAQESTADFQSGLRALIL